MNINFLRIPISYLSDIDNLNEFLGLTEDNLEALKIGYSEEGLKGIVETVRWATQHPEYDFKSLFPSVPYENEDIYEYLCKFEKNLHRL